MMWQVGDLDPAEAMLTAQLDTFAQPRMFADHAPARVFGVAEPAEGCRLDFDGASLTRQLQALRVLLKASREITPREEEISSKIAQTCLVGLKAMRDGCSFRPCQICQGSRDVVGDPLHGGKANPGPAAIRVAAELLGLCRLVPRLAPEVSVENGGR
jgi:hypothetical protein